MKIGFASDIHQLVYGKPLTLGGVKVPCSFGQVAHSDGDVIYHAVSEAILGALALGDLGDHFPDNDPYTLGMNSRLIVTHVVNLMNKKGFKVGNVDVSVTLEQPKLKPFKEAMRANLAELLNVDISCVSIKAGTNEKLDALGQGLAVKAEAIVLLEETK